MKYISLNQFEKYDENPYVEKVINEIQEHTVWKKKFIKGNRSTMNHIINDQGELVGQSALLHMMKMEDTKFIKVYKFSSFYELTKPSLKMLDYIIAQCIVPNKDLFYINFTEARKFTRYTADNMIRTGLAGLIKENIIARTGNPVKFYLNPMVLFNGNRIKFSESYLKRKNSP